MALALIPVKNREPHQEQLTTLDGRQFILRFDYIGRIQRWTFSLAQFDGTWLLRAKPLVGGVDMLRQIRHNASAPQGALLLLDLEGGDTDPDFDSLGVRHRVGYFSDG